MKVISKDTHVVVDDGVSVNGRETAVVIDFVCRRVSRIILAAGDDDYVLRVKKGTVHNSVPLPTAL